ncbi:MAG TPA: tetratricopeptide repeat protein [Cellvibrionaceae bacterium]
MTKNHKFPALMKWPLLISLGYLAGCAGTSHKPTIADVDFSRTPQKTQQQTSAQQTRTQIVQSYYQYIENAPKNDKLREDALGRLAALEIDNANLESENPQLSPEALNRANNLLQQSLRDYPNSTNKDRALYQLAQVYEQLGRTAESVQSLQTIIKDYPKSPFIAEAHFRVAEDAFKRGEYLTAESSYSEALLAPNNGLFAERALYKRGWARFKQNVFNDATDDFLAALRQQTYSDLNQLSESKKALINELLRAASLAAAHLPEQSMPALLGDDFVWAYEFFENLAEVKRRVSPAQALTAMGVFIQHYPQSPRMPLAYLYQLKLYAQLNQWPSFDEALTRLYTNYQPEAAFWQQNPNVDKAYVLTGLRKNILTAAGQGISNANAQQISHANVWSERYLKHFAAYAQQDKMYKQYALLLTANKDNEKALSYYEKSAFDGDIILDKDAAYAAIVTNDQLIQKSAPPARQALAIKMARHSKAYAQMYPQDKRSIELILRAADINMQEENSLQVVELVSNLPPGSPLAEQQKAAAFKAQAQADLKRFDEAQATIMSAYSAKLTSSENTALADSLANILIKQAEEARTNNNTLQAAGLYARIAALIPQHELAPKGLYQAATLSAEQGQWAQAAGFGQDFQQRYPNHELIGDVNRLLSSSYLKSNNQGKAAESLEALAKNEKDAGVKAAALWQAANLYAQQNDKLAATRALNQYVDNYPKPAGQYMEALYKLAQLNATDAKQRQIILDKIHLVNTQTALSDKTERTAYIASWAQLQKANEQYAQFQRVRLVEPLAQNLALKKQALQNCVSLYTQAGANNQLDILAEASFQVASIYEDFAKALLASERPRQLKGDDLEQYNVLLEDQAFPFEDKAIEFHQINLARLKSADNPWLQKSLAALRRLTPARYGRTAKVSFYE